MLAYRLLEWGVSPVLTEVPVPQAGPNEVIVRVAGCGLCHSDLAMMSIPAAIGEGIGWRVPFTLGHETAGWVHQIGDGVKDLGGFGGLGGLGLGSPVAIASPSSCGRCRLCRAGKDNACPNGLVGRGYGRDGGLTEFVRVDDPRALLALPNGLDPVVAGPLTDAGATSYHGVKRVLAKLGDESWVVVIGAGGLGSYAVAILSTLTKARICVLDPDPSRRQVAMALGATSAIDGVSKDAQSETLVREIIGKDLADAVIDFVGTDDTIAFSLGVCASGGSVAIVGAGGGTLRKPWFGNLPRDGDVFTFQGSDLSDAKAVIALAAEGAINVPVVHYPLGEVALAYEALRSGSVAGRIVVRP